MSLDETQQQALALISELIQELDGIVRQVRQDGDSRAALEKLTRWKEHAVRRVSEGINRSEGEKLAAKESGRFFTGEPLLQNLERKVDVYLSFLRALAEEIEKHPEDVLSPSATTAAPDQLTDAPQTAASQSVFIVHGHDEVNLLKLEKLLRDQWRLEPIVLRDEPGGDQTLIEKFERIAKQACYAFVILTPDDVIETPDGHYTQARPNVVFELGWFYGHLGREQVCILSKKDTNLHSDLKGISRVEFVDSIEEKVLEIEGELRGVGLLRSRP